MLMGMEQEKLPEEKTPMGPQLQRSAAEDWVMEEVNKAPVHKKRIGRHPQSWMVTGLPSYALREPPGAKSRAGWR